MKNTLRYSLFLAGCVLLAPFASAQSLVSDDFSSATQTTSGGGSSTPIGVWSTTDLGQQRWYVSNAGLTMTGDSGVLTATTTTGSGVMALTFFQPTTQNITSTSTETPTSVTLAQGEILTMTMDFGWNVGSPAMNTTRFALFNSGGLTPALNSSGLVGNGSSATTINTNNAPYLNWAGYGVSISPTGSVTNIERIVGANTSLIGSSGTWTNANSTSISETPITIGNVYQTTLAIERTVTDELIFTSTISGGDWGATIVTTSWTDITPTGGFTFDSLAFLTPGNNSIRFDNVNVSVIPEPSTYAAIFGALVLAGVVGSRMRRKK